jgi:hypothetical protein
MITEENELAKKISGGLSGVAGEYFVAAELSRRGYIATLTLKNTKGIDILVSDVNAKKSIAIQVKTNQGSRKSWVLTKKSEELSSANLFYVFVNLKGENQFPDFHIVPSAIVASTITSGHQAWLNTPAKSGKPHNDNNMRMFGDPSDDYLDRWDLLKF